MTRSTPPPDTHAAQAERIAAFCERNPGAYYTAAELTAACDLGSASKVLSAMAAMGYRIDKARRDVICDGGRHSRRLRTYCVTGRLPPLPLFDQA